MALRNITTEWAMPVFYWKAAMVQFAMSKTRSVLFRPVSDAAVVVPDNAWVNVRYD
jgi:hypothetical protein